MAKKKPAAATVPPRRNCACMQVHHSLLETVPGYRARLVELERVSRARLRTEAIARTSPFSIKVVVHVLHNKPAEKITVSQVKSQIAVLNKDFRAKNPDRSKVPPVWKGLVSDAMIEFKLATTDPAGSPTTGITFTQTSRASFPADDSMKSAATGGADAWDTAKYLNIWVCTLGDGLLGYAQFPEGPPATDGVVVLNTAFGTRGIAAPPFNLGRTTTHEVGHFLNLRHIWGDTEDCSGGDFVADTPNAETPNFGKPAFPHISCGNGPAGDMFVNYMDYTDDAAMFMFTPGQVDRMHAALEGPRKPLVS